MLKFININKEKEICLPNKEYVSGTDESTNVVAKSIGHIHITTGVKISSGFLLVVSVTHFPTHSFVLFLA